MRIITAVTVATSFLCRWRITVLWQLCHSKVQGGLPHLPRNTEINRRYLRSTATLQIPHDPGHA
jgi:hypothetical protein